MTPNSFFLLKVISCQRYCMSVFLICSFLKSLDEMQYIQLDIKGCCKPCLMDRQPILLERRVTKPYLRI